MHKVSWIIYHKLTKFFPDAYATRQTNLKITINVFEYSANESIMVEKMFDVTVYNLFCTKEFPVIYTNRIEIEMSSTRYLQEVQFFLQTTHRITCNFSIYH